jgi:hypothetical protein
MAWLLIDSCERMRLRLALIPERGELKEIIIEGSRNSVLAEIEQRVSPEELGTLSGILLVYGPGSFSAVRGGVIIANLLSRLYHVPLYGFTKEEAVDLLDVRRQLIAGTKESSAYISPLYDAAPNITIKGSEISGRKPASV